MKIEEVVIKFEETVIKTSKRMTAIEDHFPDLKFSVMKIEVFSEGLYDANQLIIPGLKNGGILNVSQKTLDTHLHIIKFTI